MPVPGRPRGRGPVRVLVVENDDDVRSLVRTVLGRSAACSVVGEIRLDDITEDVVLDLRPDVVLLDPPLDEGPAIVERVRRTGPVHAVVVFTPHTEVHDALHGLVDDALLQGSGILALPDRLVRAVRGRQAAAVGRGVPPPA